MIRAGLRALVALFALALCAGQAQAACGDWLASHGSQQSGHDQAAPVNSPPRCSGPSCQQSPPPQPKSPLTELVVIDKAALIAESLVELTPDPCQRFTRPLSDRRSPTLARSPLERPPRS